jgi:hypothetical protein
MEMLKKLVLALALLIMYLLIDNLWRVLGQFDMFSEINQWIQYSIRYTLQIGLCFAFTLTLLSFVKEPYNLFDTLGLKTKTSYGLFISILFTLPMLLGYSIIAPLNMEITFLEILFWSFISGFSEELLFRGFLFGLLFRVLKIGFFPSIFLASILFGIGHLYQGGDLNNTLIIFAITFFGSLVFGWLYIEWDNNLWVPIGTHIFMNLYWSIFDLDATNALGGWGANIFRFLTILLIIVLTFLKIKKDGSHLKGKLLTLDYNYGH